MRMPLLLAGMAVIESIITDNDRSDPRSTKYTCGDPLRYHMYTKETESARLRQANCGSS